MPVPKKRLGRSDQGHRRSNWKLAKPQPTTCTNCGAPILAHTLCGTCGFYKGKLVSTRYARGVSEEE